MLLPAPKRAYDSRQGGAGKLTGGVPPTPRSIPITSVVTQVPASASAIVGNLAITQPDAGGFATVWPTGAWPGTANINFNAGADISNSITVGLSNGSILVGASVPTHVVIDVAGYIP